MEGQIGPRILGIVAAGDAFSVAGHVVHLYARQDIQLPNAHAALDR